MSNTANNEPKSKLVFMLPTWGEPFLVGECLTKNVHDEGILLRGIVRGDFEDCGEYATSWFVHPLFTETKGRWYVMHQALMDKRTKAYCNEDGYDKQLQANVGTVTRRGIGGCPHLLGDIAVVIPPSVIKKLKLCKDAFTVIRPPRMEGDCEALSDDYPYWEFEDEEEEARIRATWGADVDFHEEYGVCYKKKL